MKGLFVALTALALTGLALYSITKSNDDSQYKEAFLKFKTQFNKSYGSKSEIDFRFGVFVQNMKKIESRNANPEIKFTSEVNHFGDMTFSEFTNQYLMDIKQNEHTPVEAVPIASGKTVDWRQTRGVVGPVKDQGQCGSCWAFSTVATFEAARSLAGNAYLSLSEQELVDCASSYGNYGCNGGLMPYAFMYIADHGLTTESKYGYRGVEGTCRASSFSERYWIKDLAQINPVDVSGLVKAIDTNVVSVAIEVQDDLMFYSGGVYHNSNCGDALNHAVNAVGYSTEGSDPYITIRNSWGPHWGENGYFRFAMGSGRGTCGIANPTDCYPVL